MWIPKSPPRDVQPLVTSNHQLMLPINIMIAKLLFCGVCDQRLEANAAIQPRSCSIFHAFDNKKALFPKLAQLYLLLEHKFTSPSNHATPLPCFLWASFREHSRIVRRSEVNLSVNFILTPNINFDLFVVIPLTAIPARGSIYRWRRKTRPKQQQKQLSNRISILLHPVLGIAQFFK